MGLRCSLLGHDYGEAFVERDREERGDEVVVTERELKECARCGSEKVTTENTEVRSLEPQRRDNGDATAEPEPTEEPAGEPAATADDGAAEGAFTSASDAIEQAEVGMETDDALAGEPDEDDAVILDDDADASDEPGSDQWDEPAEPEADPDPEPVEDDAEVVDAGPSSDPDSGAQTEYVEQSQSQPEAESASTLDRDRGEWPDADGEDEGFDATETADADAEVSATETDESTFEFGAEDGAVEADTGFTSAGPVETNEAADELDFALYCPECGFERYAAGSSLRAGDICPECQRGYLAEDR
jgi:hypothetical protein